MFRTLKQRYQRDNDYPERTFDLQILNRVLDGTLYDVLKYEFHEEETGRSEYVRLCDRAPSVRSNLCRTVVSQSVSFLFGEGRFPTIFSPDLHTLETLGHLAREIELNRVMIEAALEGSVGSVALQIRIIDSQVFLDVLPTTYLTPIYNPKNPRELLRVIERYKVRGADLRAQGYQIADDLLTTDHWFQRIWDQDVEQWFMPQPVGKSNQPRVDQSRTVEHRLGFCPIVWIRNLPGGRGPDGASTFWGAIDAQIEIEYQLSQLGRGLKYSQDPLILVKESSSPDGNITTAGGKILSLGPDGDAKMLEISGTASQAVIDYCRYLRETALEQIHGNRASPDKIVAGAMSGRAMELLYHDNISLADNLRISYGNAILQIITLIMRAAKQMPISVAGKRMEDLDFDQPITLRWPHWFEPTESDKSVQSQTQVAYVQAGLLSKETSVGVIAKTFDIESVKAELERIKVDEEAADQRAKSEQAQIRFRNTIQD